MADAPDTDAPLAGLIRQHLPEDGCLSNVARRLGINVHRLMRVAKKNGIQYPNSHATAEQIRKAIRIVTVEGASIREASRRVGISRSAVHRYVTDATDPDASLTAFIRQHLPEDGCLSNVARRAELNVHRLMRAAKKYGIPYPNAHATPEQIRKAIRIVTAEGASIREASRRVGISRSAVHRYVTQAREDNAGRASGGFAPIRVRPYRCPRHGKSIISPCPACEVLAELGQI